MAEIITCNTAKGGVGKSTSVCNVAAALALSGRKTLILDCDPQCNATRSLGMHGTDNTIAEALLDGKELPVFEISDSLFISPGSSRMNSFPSPSMEIPEDALIDCLEPILKDYDYILLDHSPALGLLQKSALYLPGAWCLIPVQSEFLSMSGAGDILNLIAKIQKRRNKDLQVLGMFLTRFVATKNLNQAALETISEDYPELIFDTQIRENISLAEAPALGQSIFKYAPSSNGATDYRALTEEIIKRIEG